MSVFPVTRVLLGLLLLGAAPVQEQEKVEKEVEHLIRLLDSDQIEDREAAVEGLIRIGRPGLPALEKAIRRGSLEVRNRARGLVTRIRWGLPAKASDELVEIAQRYELSSAKKRVEILTTLARSTDPVFQQTFARAWSVLEDPGTIAALAGDLQKWDTQHVEERLRRLESGGDPRILRALGEVLVLRGDFFGAAEAFGLAYKADPDAPGGLAKWSKALFSAHRDDELVEAAGGKALSALPLSRRAEALYRAGRVREARAQLAEASDAGAAQIAYRYGDPGLALKILESAGKDAFSLGVLALLETGDLEGAKKRARSIGNVGVNAGLARSILGSQGDFGLMAPGFISEAAGFDSAPAKLHGRLAALLAGEDPQAAIAEYKKALFLDPDFPGAREGLARVRKQAGSDRTDAGAWIESRPIGAYHRLFAHPPVRIGDHFYFMNREGHLLKSRDLEGGKPEWVYRPPRRHRLYFRGWQFEWYHDRPQIEKWNGSLVVLYDRGRHTHSKEGTGGGNGKFMAVIDPETGREIWSRSFPDMDDGWVFPEEGVIVFASGGLAVFDLEKRAWRWAVAGLEGGSSLAVAKGGFVTAGFGSGMLLKARLDDGSVVWRRSEGVAARGTLCLEEANGNLIWSPGGGKLRSVSPETGETIWETPLRWMEYGAFHRKGEVLYATSRSPLAVTAVSLADGRILWERLLARAWTSGVWKVVPQGLVFLSSEELLLLDRESGKMLLACPWLHSNPAFNSYRAKLHVRGETVLMSTASAFDLQVELTSDYDPEKPTGFSRLHLRPARLAGPPSAARRLARGEKDVRARISLLEDACMGGDALDASAWSDLAHAYAEAGEFEAAAKAARSSLLLDPPSSDSLRAWKKTLEAWRVRGEKVWKLGSLAQFVDKQLKSAELAEQILSGALPEVNEKSGDPMIRDLLVHEDPDVRLRAAIVLGRRDKELVIPELAEGLSNAEPGPALRAAGALVRLWASHRHRETRGWGRSGRSWEEAKVHFRRAAERKESAVRGAARVLLRLTQPDSEGAVDAADLESARRAGGPLMDLAASAAQAGQGDRAARGRVVKAIGHDRADVHTTAIWFSGLLRLEEAVDPIVGRFKNAESHALEALSRIGTEAALNFFSGKSSFYFTRGKALLLARRGTREDVTRLFGMLENRGSFARSRAAFWGIGEVDTSRARRGRVAFGEDLLRVSPERSFYRKAIVQTLLAEEEWNEAGRHMSALESHWPPIADVKDLRYRLLAGRGKDEAARRMRGEAERAYLRRAEWEPARGEHPYKAGLLFIEPGRLNDPAVARKHFQEALRRAPGNARYAEALDRVGRGK